MKKDLEEVKKRNALDEQVTISEKDGKVDGFKIDLNVEKYLKTEDKEENEVKEDNSQPYLDSLIDKNTIVKTNTHTNSTGGLDLKANTNEGTLLDLRKAELNCLARTLKWYGLPLSIATLFCDSPEPRVCKAIISGLQAHSPGLVSLCGLPGLTGWACHAGIRVLSEQALELIRDIHYYYSICTSTNDNWKSVFADLGPYNSCLPLSTQCLFFSRTVHRMINAWRDLISYFKSISDSGKAEHISIPKLHLNILFLAHALEPLCAFQQDHDCSTGDLARALQLVSTHIHSYTTCLRHPFAAERFFGPQDPNLLYSEKELPPGSDVHIGVRGREYLCKQEMVIKRDEKEEFLKRAFAFYTAVTESITAGLPLRLGYLALRNIGLLLNPFERTHGGKIQSQAVKVVAELGKQLGLGTSEDISRLSTEYMEYITLKEDRRKEERSTGFLSSMLRNTEQHLEKILPTTDKTSVLRRLFLTLLALPRSLHRDCVFSQVFEGNSGKNLCNIDQNRSTRQHRQEVGPRMKIRPDVVVDAEEDSLAEDSLAEDSVETMVPLSFPTLLRAESDTGNSSDVVDITDDCMEPKKRIALFVKQTESIVIDDSDEDIIWADTVDLHLMSRSCKVDITPPNATPTTEIPSDGGGYELGELVWGQVEGYSLWPGIVVPWKTQHTPSGMRRVEWYGDGMFSEISIQGLHPFSTFSQSFCSNSFATTLNYRDAIFQSLLVVADRCKMQFCLSTEEKEERLSLMLDWAFGGFKPLGPEGLQPPSNTEGISKKNLRPKINKPGFNKMTATSIRTTTTATTPNIKDDMTSSKRTCNILDKFSLNLNGNDSSSLDCDFGERGHGEIAKEGEENCCGEKRTGGWGVGKRPKQKKISLPTGDDCMSPDYQPSQKRKTYNNINNSKSKEENTYVQPNQRVRAEMVAKIIDFELDMEAYCLCCGTNDIQIFHPLFKGGLCFECKSNFTETLYRYDEDGFQSYCTVCCYGLEVILCGNDSCCRSYCRDCLGILVGEGTFESLKEVDPWICFLCQPPKSHRALTPRQDWSIRVQEFFANNSAMEFEPHRVYPSIPANLRQPIRVLSLFDGIATGYLVLKELGFKLEKYIASEICEESVIVGTVNHDGQIIQVGDVKSITEDHIKIWGPFDLLIGGSPCNDLSIVNPVRKGLYEGTGRLFFEYYRILNILKPKEDDPRPFFWLFENVVFMNTHDKVNICRYLECNPVLLDAVKVSPAHRARYFWGNIPGMKRPIIATQNDKLNLQDCLEIGREAKYTKVRTITTNPASLKQGKDVSKLPVVQDGLDDNLWITEIERIFGFPKHYTDVKNMNRQQRQKVLGKSWSVPVIRHLISPLKDYFACEQLPQTSFQDTGLHGNCA